MRVIFLIHGFSPGGAEVNCLRIARDLSSEPDIQLSVVLLNELKDPIPEEFKDLNISSFKIGTSGLPIKDRLLRLIKLPANLRSRLIEINPDIIVSFIDQTNIITLLSTLGLPYKTIVSERINPLRTSLPDRTPALFRLLFIFFRDLVYRCADKVVVQTHDARSTLPAALQSKTEVIPNSAPVIFETSEVSSREPFILSVGRLTKQKRFDVLIDAFKIFVKETPHWRLIIAGEGPLRKVLQKKISDLNLHNQVKLIGNISDLAPLYKSCGIFTLSSDYEGFPTVLLEAASYGCPIVATDCDFGARDILGWSKAGLIVPTGSPVELAYKFDLLANTNEAKDELKKGTQLVRQHFSPERVKNLWLKILHSVQEDKSLPQEPL